MATVKIKVWANKFRDETKWEDVEALGTIWGDPPLIAATPVESFRGGDTAYSVTHLPTGRALTEYVFNAKGRAIEVAREMAYLLLVEYQSELWYSKNKEAFVAAAKLMGLDKKLKAIEMRWREEQSIKAGKERSKESREAWDRQYIKSLTGEMR